MTERVLRRNREDDCLLAPRLCASLIKELRVLSLTWPDPRLPPPSDVEAEQDVTVGVLTGVAAPSELGVGPNDAIVPLYRAVLAAARALEARGAPIDVASVAAEMMHAGKAIVGLDSLLHTLTSTTPYMAGRQLIRAAERVRERGAARSICRELGRLDSLLRADLIDAERARQYIASLVTDTPHAAPGANP